MSEGNSKRLDHLLGALDDARKSLDTWQDQRTQAMISIDSFAYDVRLITEEKNQILEEYQAAQKVFADREIAFQKQIDAFTDEIQELKLESDNLRKDLEASRNQIAIAKAEVETQIHVQKHLEEKFAQDVTRVRTEVEAKDQAARKNDAATIDKLNSEVALIQGERDRQEVRARRAELELQTLRAQLHTALTQSSAGAASNFDQQIKGVGTPISPMPNLSNDPSTEKPARELVQDYLKRLGY